MTAIGHKTKCISFTFINTNTNTDKEKAQEHGEKVNQVSHWSDPQIFFKLAKTKEEYVFPPSKIE